MLGLGVYPASVTPFDAKGRVDPAQLARLLAYFEAAGCRGAVLAGTNGEGPSLSAPEKRDLLFAASGLRGKLQLVLGIGTPSLSEAVWLCRQAGAAAAEGVLLMPPGYFRSTSEQGITDWFRAVLDESPVPVLLYNFPKMTGFTMSEAFVADLAGHPRVAGLKDSSGEEGNLAAYRRAMPADKVLYVGDETQIVTALEAGWSGTISGAANVVPQWLSRIVGEWFEEGWRDSALAKFELLLPVLQAVRALPQPAANKTMLRLLGIQEFSTPRLPLLEAEEDAVKAALEMVRARLGVHAGDLALS